MPLLPDTQTSIGGADYQLYLANLQKEYTLEPEYAAVRPKVRDQKAIERALKREAKQERKEKAREEAKIAKALAMEAEIMGRELDNEPQDDQIGPEFGAAYQAKRKRDAILPPKPSQDTVDKFYQDLAGLAEPVQWDRADEALYNDLPKWDDTKYAEALALWPQTVSQQEAEAILAEFQSLTTEDADLNKVRKSILGALGF
ncbi:hypothetical protein OA88_22970 [Flavobacterium sp. JRM]|nr:hypothetical protein OA88_22970 [Flavobacterium sp. JRM]